MSRFERWSRKKRGVESDEADTEFNNCSIGNAESEANALTTSRDDETLDEASLHEASLHERGLQTEPPVDDAPLAPGSLDHTLPDPDHLPAGSDFSAFMSSGVSAALRRRALKRLWATGNYNVRDGLDDYDADYRQQLKPMASELAGKLRRWANKTEEALERPADADDENRMADDAATPAEDVNSCTSDANVVQNSRLDDQSDSFDGEVDECIKKQ